MRFKISFDLIQDIEKQEKDFRVSEEKMKDFQENKDKYIDKHIREIKNMIIDDFSFKDYVYVENLKIEEVEND